MKLPPLPRMPRKKKDDEGGDELPRVKKDKAAGLPDLNPLAAIIGIDEVNPGKGVTMDETREGRWFETDDPRNKIGGRCCQCGGLKRAINLRYAVGPFGRWEGWACGPCRNERKGVEFSKQAREGKSKKAPNIVAPIPPTKWEKEVAWFRDRMNEADEIVTWEGEGGAI